MRRWAWVYEELRDLQAADDEELRRQREAEQPRAVADDPEDGGADADETPDAISAPAEEVVDLGLMHYEDAVVEVRRTAPPPRRVRSRNHRT